ncbi:hypothetical protein MIND_00961400 [Mycena indigotica]|uniref:Hydroxyneurosporene synthase n=1 Tax=Mycena indigotica TaxID=2126181 RepID=A0A8H6SF89_9AGAR|nr:uncharacterized protein MIND_00961400 [Mycena indigotica]KAF7297282.1 hypothetical protein MIND_00961400 [Mycena indigotica]
MHLSLLQSLASGLTAFPLLGAASKPGPTIYHIPSTPQNGTAQAQLISSASGFDAPKATPITNSSFDWWYFDVASNNPADLASITIVFFTTTQQGFPFTESSSATPVRISGTYSNGTLWDLTLDGDGSGATVVVDGEATSGNWSSGVTWHATSTSNYLITLDTPRLKGAITFQSVAPAHLPCGADAPGQNLEVGPRIGWANAIPDANSSVRLNITGTVLAFDGLGYHDKNWSDLPFTTNVASWYWGHARVGPLSIVWFDFLDLEGNESVSVYVSRNNTIVTASCSPGSIQVRPTGSTEQAAYPPVVSNPDPAGYRIEIVGGLALNISVLVPAVPTNPFYTRSIGTISTMVDGKFYSGRALFEQFKLVQS